MINVQFICTFIIDKEGYSKLHLNKEKTTRLEINWSDRYDIF